MKFTHEMNDLQKADFLATIASEIPDTERLFARVLSDMPRGLEFFGGAPCRPPADDAATKS